MRILPLILSVTLLAIQWPLWFGERGWLTVWRLDRELDSRVRSNDLLASRNEALSAEVRDLGNGHLAIEERARYELGMIGEDEIFIQINKPPASDPAAPGADGSVERPMHARR